MIDEIRGRVARRLLDLVHDLAPSAIGRNKLQDTLMLDVALDFAGQDDVVIIDRGVNVGAAQNRVAVKQIRDGILDSPVLAWVLCLWRFRRAGRMRAGRRRIILAMQGCREHQESGERESGERGERENESAGHDWASLRGTASVWHGSATGFNVSAGRELLPGRIRASSLTAGKLETK
jgi:hypothetical protein